jgi:RNA polymerase sigma-70 factor (ECF subfamily)
VLAALAQPRPVVRLWHPDNFADSVRSVETTSAAERAELEALRAGDERAFAALVTRLSPALLRTARAHVSSHSVAEEVVQDTWRAVIEQLDRFEGRSSLRTWIFAILVNRAKTRGVREAKIVPFTSLAAAEAGSDEPAVDADRFHAGAWSDPPHAFPRSPEQRALAREAVGVVERAVAALPPAQRAVITLRDIDGFPAEEACELLELTEGNQRVLLHRARAKVRAALEAYHEEAAS